MTENGGCWQDTEIVCTSSCSSCSRMACRKALRSWLDDFWSNIPAWMTFWSTFSLYLAAARIFSSTLFTVHRRSTRTSFCCPIRWARSWACRSYDRPERSIQKQKILWKNKTNKRYCIKSIRIMKITEIILLKLLHILFYRNYKDSLYKCIKLFYTDSIVLKLTFYNKEKI